MDEKAQTGKNVNTRKCEKLNERVSYPKINHTPHNVHLVHNSNSYAYTNT